MPVKAIDVQGVAAKFSASGIKTELQYFYTLGVQVEGQQVVIGVGALQSFSPSETRPITRLGQVGSDEYYELVPGRAENSMTISRLVLLAENIFEAFGWPMGGAVDSLRNQRVPMTITEYRYNPDGTWKTRTYLDCWISDYGKTIDQGTVEISEDVTVQIRKVETPEAIE